MGALVVTENVTLDGVIEQVDEWFGPAEGTADGGGSDMEATVRRHMAAQGALLLGRRTFEAFRGYWPAQADDPMGIRTHLDAVPKYVLSRTLGEPGWARTTVLRGELADEVRRLKASVAGAIGVTGSITLVHGLVAAGLVDEYRLFVYPVVVGHGRPLFDRARGVPRLRLVATETYRSGVVLLCYRPARP